jgi:nucleoside-diphosphate-sugar epimerase
MTRRAFIMGGSGQIGRAIAASLLSAGWRVTSGQRNPESFPSGLRDRGAVAVTLDREDASAVADAMREGFDAVIDTVAYNAEHARQWLGLQDRIGALAVISTGSVYADDQGRTLDEARKSGFPVFPVPIGEGQLRVAAGDATYSTRKVAMEDALLEGAIVPLTILRPFAVHGPGSRAPREWWFITRVLNGDSEIPVAYGGLSRFHTSATANIAELCKVSLERGGTRVLNAADPQALTVAEIGQALLDALGSDAIIRPFAGAPMGLSGYTPWSVARPVVGDMSRAAALGYRPVTDFRRAAPETCNWLIAEARANGWQTAFPGLSAYPAAMFLGSEQT